MRSGIRTADHDDSRAVRGTHHDGAAAAANAAAAAATARVCVYVNAAVPFKTRRGLPSKYVFVLQSTSCVVL